MFIDLHKSALIIISMAFFDDKKTIPTYAIIIVYSLQCAQFDCF